MIITSALDVSLADFSNIFYISKLNAKEARHIASIILDTMDILDWNIAVTNHKTHNKRYIITKYQRAAIGSHITIKYDNNQKYYTKLYNFLIGDQDMENINMSLKKTKS